METTAVAVKYNSLLRVLGDVVVMVTQSWFSGAASHHHRWIMQLFIAMSTFGAVNGEFFSAARLSLTLLCDDPLCCTTWWCCELKPCAEAWNKAGFLMSNPRHLCVVYEHPVLRELPTSEFLVEGGNVHFLEIIKVGTVCLVSCPITQAKCPSSFSVFSQLRSSRVTQ